MSTKAEVTRRRRQVAELYLSDITLVEIAEKMQCGLGTIHRDIEFCRGKWDARIQENHVRFKAHELAQIEHLERLSFIRFYETKEVKWIAQIVHLKERKAKMLGLDAPTKITPTNMDGTEPYADMSDADLFAKIKRIAVAIEMRDGEVLDDPIRVLPSVSP